MILKKTIFIISLCLVNSIAFSQNLTEVSLLQRHSHGAIEKKSYVEASKNETEYEVFFSGLFLMYKKFLSSQDGQSCSFTPSCSEYGLFAVKQQGIIGLFNTFDRLSRCNGLSAHQYERDLKTGLLIDNL